MSQTASSASDSVASSHRRSAPPVVQLDEAVVADSALEAFEGSIAVLWTAASESGLLDEVERAAIVDDPEQSAAATRRLTAAMDRATESDRGAARSGSATRFDLEYAGRTLTDGLRRADAEPFAAAGIPYNGGELDDTAFRIHERGPADASADYEYLVLVVPPVLDEGEQATTAVIPDDATASIAIGNTPAGFSLVDVLASAAYLAPTASVGTIGPDTSLEDGSGAGSVDHLSTDNPSVDELLEARA